MLLCWCRSGRLPRGLKESLRMCILWSAPVRTPSSVYFDTCPAWYLGRNEVRLHDMCSMGNAYCDCQCGILEVHGHQCAVILPRCPPCSHTLYRIADMFLDWCCQNDSGDSSCAHVTHPSLALMGSGRRRFDLVNASASHLRRYLRYM